LGHGRAEGVSARERFVGTSGGVVHTFTFDTNCLIAIEKQEPDCAALRTLTDSHLAGQANVAVVAISASEARRGGNYEKFSDFQDRLAAIRLSHLEILQPMAYFDLTFWDWSIWASPEMEALERRIHEVLFRNREFYWQDHCRNHGLDARTLPDRGWRNRKCDVQAMWCHINHCRDVFVTSDENFHGPEKLPALIALGAREIKRPRAAVDLL
jgi:hypothetical protein